MFGIVILHAPAPGKLILKLCVATYFLICGAGFSPASPTHYPVCVHLNKSRSLWIFFGHLKGHFEGEYSPYLADQLLYGLSIDFSDQGAGGLNISFSPINRFPVVTSDRYIDSGFASPGFHLNAAAAIVIDCTGKTHSAALFQPTSLSIFIRDKRESPLAINAFQGWAEQLLAQGVWASPKGTRFVTRVFNLEGYGDKSVN